MNAPRVLLTLDGDRAGYSPGEVLAGSYQLAGAALDEVEALELSVLWHTEGTGDEDFTVHYFERWEAGRGQPLLPAPRRFSTRLPNSPLSYEGVIIKIRWCVRVRAFLARGKEAFAERPFTLGSLPAAQLVEVA